MWLLSFFDEIFLLQKQLITLFIDNNKSFDITKTYWGYKETKHINVYHSWKREWEEHKKFSTTTWGTNWYYMRKIQGAVNYELNMKQIPTYI